MKNETNYPRSTTPVLRAIVLVSLIFVSSIIMSGCASVGVQAWERDLMRSGKCSQLPILWSLVLMIIFILAKKHQQAEKARTVEVVDAIRA